LIFKFYFLFKVNKPFFWKRKNIMSDGEAFAYALDDIETAVARAECNGKTSVCQELEEVSSFKNLLKDLEPQLKKKISTRKIEKFEILVLNQKTFVKFEFSL